MIRIFLIILVVLFAGDGWSAIYVDPTDSGSLNQGTYAEPYNQCSTFRLQVANGSPGDDYYIKVGTTLRCSSEINLLHDGVSESNPTVIGAYYGENQFGLNGNARPIIDGDDDGDGDWDAPVIPSGLWRANKGLIHGVFTSVDNVYSWDFSHVTIKDLEIKNSLGAGITLGAYYPGQASNMTIENCIVHDTGAQAILLVRTKDSLVDNNVVYRTSRLPELLASGNKDYSAGGLEITGMYQVCAGGTSNCILYPSQNNTVSNNVLYGMQEGLAIYQTSQYNTVDGNTIFDLGKNAIYLANAKYNTIKNNVIYETTASSSHWAALDPSSVDSTAGTTVSCTSINHACNGTEQTTAYPTIKIACEGQLNRPEATRIIGDDEVHDNYIGGGASGIEIDLGQCKGTSTTNHNIKIHDNIFVENSTNFKFFNISSQWDGHEIYDNISLIFNDGSYSHANNYSPTGVTWSDNYFGDETQRVSVSGNAQTSNTKTCNGIACTLAANNNSSYWRTLDSGSLGATSPPYTSSIFDLAGAAAQTCTGAGYNCCVEGTTPQTTYDSSCTGTGQECYTTCTTAAYTIDATNTYGGLGGTEVPDRAFLFYEGSGTTVDDGSTDDSDVTLENPDWQTEGIKMTQTGQTATFALPTMADDFSIFMTYTANDNDGLPYGKFFYTKETDGSAYVQLAHATDSSFRIQSEGVVTDVSATNSIDMFDSGFHSILFTSDDSGNVRKVYVDGVLEVNSTVSFANPTSWATNMGIGNTYTSKAYPLDGTVHTFIMYNGEILDADDALALHQNYTQMWTPDPGRSNVTGGSSGSNVIGSTTKVRPSSGAKPVRPGMHTTYPATRP